MEKNRFVDLFKNYANKGKSDDTSVKPGFSSITNKKSDEELAHAISMRVGISYITEDKSIVEKIIVIRRILNQGNDLILNALDEQEGQPRMFYASRIKRITDITTGEHYGNAKDFIMTHAAVGDMHRTSDISDNFNRVINRVRSEVTALVFLASVDGHYMDSQKRMIVDYIALRNNDVHHSQNEIMRYIERLHPDLESFYDAIDDISNQNPAVIQIFMERFVQLVFADGFVNDKERMALAELVQTFKEDGIDLKISV